jgi:hypothetical protein
MNKIREWYTRNQDAISWFLIGLLSGQALDQLARREYFGALLSAALAAVNYYFVRVRL